MKNNTQTVPVYVSIAEHVVQKCCKSKTMGGDTRDVRQTCCRGKHEYSQWYYPYLYVHTPPPDASALPDDAALAFPEATFCARSQSPRAIPHSMCWGLRPVSSVCRYVRHPFFVHDTVGSSSIELSLRDLRVRRVLCVIAIIISNSRSQCSIKEGD